MTKEEKQLLLKDLCARLPYNTKVSMDYGFGQPEIKKLCIVHISQLMGNQCASKPYLRPMSSMTEEERQNYERLLTDVHYKTRPSTTLSLIDWLNAHHFDYRDLIGKGLAIEVTQKNNPYKD